jgi:hypothetical protein
MDLIKFTPEIRGPTAENEMKVRFLEVLEDTLLVEKACADLNITRQKAQSWKRKDPEFATKWDTVFADCEDRVFETMVARALQGSDKAAEFVLKSLNRQKYDDAVARNTTTGSGVKITLVSAKKVANG